MEEKRKLQRRHLIYYLRVFHRDQNTLLGHLVDITPEGLMLMSEHPIEPNQVLPVRMVLPAEIFGEPEIEFNIQTVWSRKDINPDFYDTGCHVVNPNSKSSAIIRTLIEEFGFLD